MTPHATSDPSEAVLDEIASVKRLVRSIDVGAYQGATPAALGELSKALARVLKEARGLGRRLTDLSEDILERAPERTTYENPLGTTRPPSALDVGDLAFVMRMTLNRSQLQLDAAKTPDLMLGVCQRCRCELEQLLAVLEERFQGAPSLPTRERGLEASLKCRRAYARLRAGVAKVGDVARGRESSVQALRAAGALISLLIASDGYPYFRVSDRLQLASLERRVLNYLEHGGTAGRGLRIFQDFKAFVEQLAVINQRQDLQKHDLGCLNRWLSELESAASRASWVGSVDKYRDAIQGRDAAFDALLEGHALTRRTLMSDLRRMLASLTPDRASFDGLLESTTPTRTSA